MAADPVAALKAACDAAYDKNGNSCSHAVWDVISACHNPKEPYRQANELVNHMTANWKKVTVDEAHTLANKGIVVVGGQKKTPNGHVIVVYPGEKADTGGYEYYYAKLKKNLVMGGRGVKYPLCMSTSMGSWPGARSKGDKTVWDPWANDAVFKTVGFWTPKSD
jgi:hypothetical protein